MKYVNARTLRRRRAVFIGVIGILILSAQLFAPVINPPASTPKEVLADTVVATPLATQLLSELPVKGRAPKTGYTRSEFGSGWAIVNGCDIRNILLKRYLQDSKVAEDGCIVQSGTLNDPYTGRQMQFIRGPSTSDDVQIDHVVALSDAWQKGAQGLSFDVRMQFANDPLNLLPVNGDANQQKGDSDAASWLPANKQYRCAYVARQIAVKKKYTLWVTEAERAAMKRVLNGCGEQRVPLET